MDDEEIHEIVYGANGTQLMTHSMIDDTEEFDFHLIVLPGGLENS